MTEPDTNAKPRIDQEIRRYLEMQTTVICAFFPAPRTKSETNTFNDLYMLLADIYRRAFNDGYKTCKTHEATIKKCILKSLRKIKDAASEIQNFTR